MQNQHICKYWKHRRDAVHLKMSTIDKITVTGVFNKCNHRTETKQSTAYIQRQPYTYVAH